MKKANEGENEHGYNGKSDMIYYEHIILVRRILTMKHPTQIK